MDQLILDLLNTAAERLGPYEYLSDAVSHEALARALKTTRSHDRVRLTERSIADSDPDEVRGWLRDLPIVADDQVMILWPALNAGIMASYRGFTNAYDDLWFPGRDDIWVCSASDQWLLEIDHEEVARFFERPKRKDG